MGALVEPEGLGLAVGEQAETIKEVKMIEVAKIL